MPPLGGVPGWFIRILFEDSRGFISKADARDVSPRLYFCSKTSVEEEAVLKEALEAMVSFFFFFIYIERNPFPDVVQSLCCSLERRLLLVVERAKFL